jgi:Serine/threonine protein phosphatase
MRIEAGVATDIGQVREGNEDSYLVEPPLFAVADGMGGHRGGEVASQLALETLEARFRASTGTLAEQVQPAIAAEGWCSGDDSPGVRDVSWGIAHFLRPAEAIGVLTRKEGRSRVARDQLALTPAGRAALTFALRVRALAPAQGLY